MKKLCFLPLVVALAATALLTSCKDEPVEKPDFVFSVTETDKNLTPPALGETYTIDVTSTKNGTRVGFEVVSAPDWAPASIDLTGLSIVVDESPERQNRPGSVVIKQEESELTITISIDQAMVTDDASIPASVNAQRLQIVTIAPQITGYDNAPQYRWSCNDATGADSLLSQTKDLVFIPTQSKIYTVKFTITDGNVTQTETASVVVAAETQAYSFMISNVFEYRPAPGWKVGPTQASPTGTAADTRSTMAQKCLDVFTGNGETGTNIVSMGNWGGYIVFGFDHTVINKPDLRDLRITSSTGSGNRARPGVIMVSMDANGNGLPDDPWYEIAGSEYDHVQTWHNVSMTYFKPADGSYSVGDNHLKWSNSRGDEGWISYKSMSNAIAQYPLWYAHYPETEESVMFTGLTRLPNNLFAAGGWPDGNGTRYSYGYVCNQMDSNEKGTSIDISWAVDGQGNRVNLPGINFVKVYTGTFQDMGEIGAGMGTYTYNYMYGEADTDMRQAYDLHLQGKAVASE